MGTEFEVTLCGADPDFLRAAAHEALDAVDALEERLSHYRETSEICDLNRRAAGEPVRMEPGLFAHLRRAAWLSEVSGGAFDITAGPLVRCWGFFRGRGAMPESEALRTALRAVGSRHLQFDPEAYTVAFARPGVEVHLGALGKGIAVDAAVEVLRGLGVTAALIHGGTSTVYGLGAPPGQDAWLVGVRHPRAEGERVGVLRLRDRALSLSGDTEQFFEHEGRRYSHILDPRTGRPARGVALAAFLADNATDTDALSTAVFVSGVGGAYRLLERNPTWGIVVLSLDDAGEVGPPTVLGEVEFAPPPAASAEVGLQ